MTNDLLERQIDEIERAVLHDDPSFAMRFRLEAPDTGHETLVFLLLAADALLLAVGLTTLAPAAWFAGSAAFIASSVVDARHQRKFALIRT